MVSQFFRFFICRDVAIGVVSVVACSSVFVTHATAATQVEKVGDKLTITTPVGEKGVFTLSADTNNTKFRVTSLDSAFTTFATASADCHTEVGPPVVAICQVKAGDPNIGKIEVVTADKDDNVQLELGDWNSNQSDPVVVRLGDGNDRYDAEKTLRAPLKVVPGIGKDALYGGCGDDTFVSENVADGGDTFADSCFNASVSYEYRSTSVSTTVDGVANDGEAGEGDDIRPSISGITGGKVADTIDMSLPVSGIVPPSGFRGSWDRTVQAGEGTDTIIEKDSPEIMGDSALKVSHHFYGGAGADTFTIRDKSGQIRNDLYGEKGNDTFDVKVDHESYVYNDLHGGENDDSFTVEGSAEWSSISRVQGEDGRDTMTVTGDVAGNNRFYLEGGNDSDIITATQGYAVLDGGQGSDQLTGGDGSDIYMLQAEGTADGADVVRETGAIGSGEDGVYYGNSRPASGSCSSDARVKPVNITDDGIANDGEVGEGDDIGSGIEVAGGGNGDDTLRGTGTIYSLQGSCGNDTLSNATFQDGDEGDDTLTALPGGSKLNGGKGQNTLIGSEGRDRIINSGTHGKIMAKGGDDIITSDGENGNISAGDGLDQVNISDHSSTVDTGSGDDTIEVSGDAKANQISTGIGTDIVRVSDSAKNNHIDAGADDDTLLIGNYQSSRFPTENILGGGAGNDTFAAIPFSGPAFAGSNTFNGNDGNDRFELNSKLELVDTKVNTVNGDDGDDVISGGTIASGGNGNDILSLTESRYESEKLPPGNLDGGPGNDTLVAGVLLSGKDPITDGLRAYYVGNSVQDKLSGGDGSDVLAVSGDDIAHGGNENDQINVVEKTRSPSTGSLPGIAGNGDFRGGDGVDTIEYSEVNDGPVHVSLNDVLGDGVNSSSKILLPTHNAHSDIENLTGSPKGDDILQGSAGTNVIYGGDSPMFVGDRPDTIVGGAGPDMLVAGANSVANIDARDDEVDRVVCTGAGAPLSGMATVDEADSVESCAKVDLPEKQKTLNNPNNSHLVGCQLPRVTGMVSSRAVDVIKGNHCKASLIFWWVSHSKQNRVVLSQSLKPGSYDDGQSVRLKVGRKTTKGTCVVPKLIGKTSSVVSAAMKKLQCNLAPLRYKVVKSKRQFGRVITQSRRGKIRAGSTVTFTIGVKKR